MNRCFACSLALLMTGCLSRTTVGAEDGFDAGNAGIVDDGAVEVGPIADFERALFGVWEAELRVRQDRIIVSFEFRRDFTLTTCVADQCTKGQYRVTEVLLDGTAIIQGRDDKGAEFTYRDVVIEGDELRFRIGIAGPDRLVFERVK